MGKVRRLKDKKEGYIAGLFEGDGYKIYDKKNRHYTIEFYLNSINDKKTISFITELLKNKNLNPHIYQDKRFNCKRIRVRSKEFFNVINKNINLKGKTREFCLGYVSGIIDSEGHYNKNKSYILVINTNLEMLERAKEFLQQVQIKSSISERKKYFKDKRKSYRFYISVKFKKLAHYSIKAGYNPLFQT